MRRQAVLMLAMLALLAGGCALAGPVVGDPVVGAPGVVPGGPGMPFPECQTAELAFAGESTLAAIGLGEFVGGPDANKLGMIWVTAGPVSIGGPMPVPAGGGKEGDIPAQRLVCVQWPDGSGMAGNIPDDWVPPGSLTGTAASDEGTGSVPLGMLALVVGAVVLVGVSVLAFRHEAS